MFDNYLMVDWSANSAPIVGANSIWLAWLKNGNGIETCNPNTRANALTEILSLLNETKGRTLIGFDFAFGYPADAYDKFKCKNWKDLWNLLSKKIIDAPDNSNNRFEVACEFNRLFPHNHGPFWGHHVAHNFPDLENHAPPEGYGGDLPSQFRHVENAVGNQPGINPNPVWQLFGNGAVGSQSLVGIPKVNELHEALNKKSSCAVWPFEKPTNHKYVIAEIYPSIWDVNEQGQVADEAQVKTVAKTVACLDKQGRLQKLLDAPDSHDRNIIEKEGWVLGVDETGTPAQCP